MTDSSNYHLTGDLRVVAVVVVIVAVVSPSLREGIHWCPMLIGGGQEHGLRAGTENVAFIAALGKPFDYRAHCII